MGGGPDACADGHPEAYLLDGRLPARDASCAPRPKPEPRPAAEAKASPRVPPRA
ncbi:hypothetical protein [Streptomyces sp. AC627_RSS907]|uniref:hypothetical protein n=1 Tax=Streptomyces sp. AC627_RSS907 TaxID=2823684 RepID=UPI0035AED229